jgi:hypothetical protein
MNDDTAYGRSWLGLNRIPVLLRGEPAALAKWIDHWRETGIGVCFSVILAGCGLFGFAIGWWRSPVQAFHSGIKLPLILILTTLGNGLLNGMLAPLLGLNVRFQQALLAVLMSFTIAAAILGAFSPLVFFMIWNTPRLSGSEDQNWAAYSFIRLALFAIIAFAGIVANTRLLRLLQTLCGNPVVARRILFAWLGGNLLLGGQIAWILRPFIGSPVLPTEFLRSTAFEGNIFEALLQSLEILMKQN